MADLNYKYHIGYTQGVFDMFHIGHLNLIKRAKEHCDYLIVGVNADELVLKYKNKHPVIPEDYRRQIVAAISYVDECIIADTLDKLEVYKHHAFDAVFIGDDWKGNERWKKTEEELKTVGAKVVYLPYTNGVSSTGLTSVKDNRVNE